MSKEDDADARAKAAQVGPDDVKAAIAKLTPESSDDEVEEVICASLDAGLAVRAMEAALKAIAEKSNTSVSTIRKLHKICAKDMRSGSENKNGEDHGLEIFSYNGEYDFDAAVKKCVGLLKRENEKAKLPLFCQINGNPVRLDLRDGRAEFVPMTRDALWSELNQRAAFVQKFEQGESARRKVPEDVAKQVYEQGYATLPPAPEVIHTPIYLKDGSLLLAGGYHYAPDDKDKPRNHLLLLNDLRVPQVPEPPTKADADEALNWLRTELLRDFPFCDANEKGDDRRGPSEANALALLLTPFMRSMIAGRTPLFAIVKPQTGSGATFLARLAINLFEGLDGARAPLNYTSNEAEMEKTLVSAIKETRSTLFFDDVKEFNNRLLLRSLTASRVGGRILGQSRIFERDNTFNWIVTGVNPRIGGEMHRRACWIRLNPKTPVGEDREYRHADYDAFVAKHRGLAIRHILTMVEYWHAQDAPEFMDRNLSGFDDWCRKVGGVLLACGVEGFLANKAVLVIDSESVTEMEFLQALQTKLKAGDELSLPVLFQWAESQELALVIGRTPDERQRNFADRVIALDGRTFGVTVSKTTTRYMLRIKQGEAGVTVGTVQVAKEPV